MNSPKSNVILWMAVLYVTSYCLIFWAVGYEGTAYILAALTFGLAVMVVVTWGSTLIRSIVEGGKEGAAVLAFSICIVPIYAICVRLWQILRIKLDNPDWMMTSPIGLSFAVLLLISFTGVLLAPETKGGNVPRKNLLWWMIAIFIAGCFIGTTIGIALSKDNVFSPTKAGLSPIVVPRCEEPKPIPVHAFCRARPNMGVTDAR